MEKAGDKDGRKGEPARKGSEGKDIEADRKVFLQIDIEKDRQTE